jgi:hypothetical protein
VFSQYIFPEDFRKKTARIDMTNRLEQLDAGDIGLQNLHAIPYPADQIWRSRCFTRSPGK